MKSGSASTPGGGGGLAITERQKPAPSCVAALFQVFAKRKLFSSSSKKSKMLPPGEIATELHSAFSAQIFFPSNPPSRNPCESAAVRQLLSSVFQCAHISSRLGDRRSAARRRRRAGRGPFWYGTGYTHPGFLSLHQIFLVTKLQFFLRISSLKF